MTQASYPFSNSPMTTQEQWSKMAQNWRETGVIKGALNELQVYADSTGMQVKVKSGRAFIEGHFYESDSEEVLAIGAANSTNPRIDRVIVRLDWITGTIQLAVLQGVAAVSPSVPALTQNSSRWEISLAQVRVNANTATIAPGNVTDERVTDLPHARFQRSTQQNINNNEYVTILGDLMFGNMTQTNNKINIAEAGIYQISVIADLTGITQDTFLSMYFVVNGVRTYATGIRGPVGWGVNSAYIPLTSTMLFKLNAGDTIEVQYLNMDGVRGVTYQQVSIYKVVD